MSAKERRTYDEQVKTKTTFKSDAQEAAFWASHDSTEYIDYSKSRRMIFPKLKPSTETISLRLPKSLLDQLKTLANKRDVPYQTLLKLFVLERVQAELHSKTAKAS
jgi:predicted DNA binding CopG/RHH family protein